MQLTPALSARTRRFALAACLFLFSALFAVAAVPPPNDQCAGADVIPGNGPFPALTPQRIIDGATTSNDPPLPPSETSFDTNITRSVWYKFTPAVSGLYTISTAFDTDTTFKDTSMVIYTATADCGPFTIHSYNEDSGTLRAAISTNLNAGTTYYIVVWVGRTEVLTVGLELQVRVSKPAVPANDTCATATVIPSSISSPYLAPVVDTTLATSTAGLAPPPCVTNLGARPAREVWYQFTPTVGGTYIFSTGADTATRIEDTSIELYTLGGDCSTPNQVDCNDNSFGRAVLSRGLTAGVTYHLAVFDNATNYVPGETDLQLRVSPATAPTAVTLPPSSISSTGVALNGNFNANGLQSRFWFEWGPTTSLGSTSAVRIRFASADTFATNLIVSGFQPATLYYYRMVGTNSLGRGEGQLQTFAFTNSSPQITTYDYEISRAFTMEFAGSANHLYIIQGSTNLVDWADLGTAIESSPAYFNYRHGSPEPHRFYRVKQP